MALSGAAGERTRLAMATTPTQPQMMPLELETGPTAVGTSDSGFLPSVANLLNAAIGAGVLALPSTIAITGLIGGNAISLLLALAIAYSLHIVGKVRRLWLLCSIPASPALPALPATSTLAEHTTHQG